jgi:hypothetical protein
MPKGPKGEKRPADVIGAAEYGETFPKRKSPAGVERGSAD